MVLKQHLTISCYGYQAHYRNIHEIYREVVKIFFHKDAACINKERTACLP